MKNKVGKIILVLGICLFIVGISYIVTKYLDKNLYLNTNLLVTFEDSKEFNLESTDVLNKEEALEVYPNKFTVENRSLKTVKYNVILTEIDSNINKENLSYILYLNDSEVKNGKISEIDKVLYTRTVGIKKTDNYKLYLYLTEKENNAEFNYKIEIES